MAYYFAPIAEGLGDLLLTLPALEALIATGEPTYLVVRSVKQLGVAELIPGLSGWLREPDFLKLSLPAADKYINLRNHPLFLNNIIGSDRFIEEFGPLSIFDVYERIARDFLTKDLGISHDFRRYQAFSARPEPRSEGKILLVPGSAGAYKCWESARWMRLIALLEQENLETLVLGKPENSEETRELISLGASHLPTEAFSAVVDAVSSARAVISVDTGLMHLAVQQGMPTIAMHQKRSVFVRTERNCHPMLAGPCVSACDAWTRATPSAVACFEDFKGPLNIACPASYQERCMNSISPEAVLSQLHKALDVQPASTRR